MKLDQNDDLFYRHPQLIECMGIFVLSLAHGFRSMRGSDVYLRIVTKLSGNVSLNSARERALGWPLLGFFSVGSFFSPFF